MSRVFVRDSERQWSALCLADPSVDLLALLLVIPASDAAGSAANGAPTARLVSFGSGEGERCAVLANSAVRVLVNGFPLAASGIRVLSHKDEIALMGHGSVFFSTEKLAEVVPFPGLGRTVYCGRCRQEIKPGSSAVKCPGCGVWHDQSEQLGCWLYADTCSCCATRTALDAGLAWAPEE